MTKLKKLVIIDSHALIHRAYHALPKTMSGPDGAPTNAVYGFTSVLVRVLRELKPDYIAAALDTPEPTFRHEEYAGYKAQRPETASDLARQIPKVKEVLAAFGIVSFEQPGFEADDIIGTLVEFFADETEVVIVTGDLDTLQLVSPHVAVYTLKKGFTDTVLYDTDAVNDRFGLTPSQMTDFKGLKGDPSDNIPGVAGIGEKTAAALLQEFGSLEKLYKELKKDAAKSVKGKVREKLLAGERAAFDSKRLATIRRDVPVRASLDALAARLPDKKAIETLFRELGFFSLLDRIDTSVLRGQPQSAEKPVSSRIADVQDAAAVFVGATKIFVSAGPAHDALYLSAAGSSDVLHLPKQLFSQARVLADEHIAKTGHDLKSISHVVGGGGGMLMGLSFDTMLASWLLDPGKRDYSFARAVFSALGEAPAIAGAQEELAYLPLLEERLTASLEEQELLGVLKDIELPLVPILFQMELVGIKLNTEALKTLSKEAEEKIGFLEKEIYSLAGTDFNISSPKQLADVLFDRLGIAAKKVRKTPKGALSTKADELEKLKGEHPVIERIMEYRELTKLANTYIDALPELVRDDGRLHTTFNQAGTATGRLSSENPNLQNVPVRGELASAIRRAFVAQEGYALVSFDYSQIELRVAASVAGDEKMMGAFKRGEDIHTRTASEIFNTPMNQVNAEMRRQAKVLNFGVLYGMGAQGFMRAAGVTKERARQFIEEYFHDFHGVADYVRNIKEEAKEKGYVKTLTGRRRYLPEITAESQMLRAQAERMAVNMPIQGTAADIMKLAMIRVHRELSGIEDREDCRMLLQVHDELVFEVKQESVGRFVPVIRRRMESAMELAVPLKVDVKTGQNWADMETIKD